MLTQHALTGLLVCLATSFLATDLMVLSLLYLLYAVYLLYSVYLIYWHESANADAACICSL